MAEQPLEEYVLGIDLGSNSLGWAIVGLVDGEPAKLIRAGVRVFEAGMEGDIESGREESRNKTRRDARLHRRQLWRHRRRLVKLGHVLQRVGLLPEADISDPEARQDFFNRLDSEILASEWFASREKSGLYPEPRQVMPYILRAAALDERLGLHYLGRAIYHLAQRRGFWSNRKRTAKKDDDEGKVKEGIAELRKAMAEANARTLGEYLSRLKPSEERMRSRWTARDMYEKEFDAIWVAQAAQAKHHPELMTEERRKELRKAIFYQRPLWFDPNTIGQCELEPGQRRAPAYLLVSQRFRLLQKVNDLHIELPGELPRYLTKEERAKLTDTLELQGHLSFHKARKINGRTIPSVRDVLGLPKTVSFNLQRGGEEKMPGNSTTSQFYAVFGERWLEMSAQEHNQAILDVLSIQKPEALKRRAANHWRLGEEASVKFCEISLEPDYVNFSRKAVEKLLPLLEQGVAVQTARKQLYPESFKSGEPKPLLPPVELTLEIRNPAVMRSLTELRKVVNAVVRQYGKPVQIRIELARELKKPKWLREEMSKKNRENERSREKARQKYKEATGDSFPSRDDLRKPQLFDESRGHCVYCGNPMAGRSLFGRESGVDIDHIIPFSRSMDDSFMNVVLCHSECNRAKGNKTPFEAYSGAENYERILERTKGFPAEKLRRFKMDDEGLQKFLDDFRNRQLNDTAYSAVLASKYLGLLFGGVKDSSGMRVQAPSGQTTYELRKLWKLDAILNDGPTTDGGYRPKSREDHRHHAVDAVVIGLTDAGMIKRLSDAAQRAPLEGRKRFASLDGPWPNFVDTIRAAIGKIVVSHRVSKKVSGALHEETIYSRPFPVAAVSSPPKKGRRSESAATEVRVRRALSPLVKSTKQISIPEIKDIVDPEVRRLVQDKLADLGGDLKKFADERNLPRFPSSGVPIKRVRISKAVPTFPLGEGRTARHVMSESNHHVEIYAELDKNGNEGKWDGEVVSMYEGFQRLKAGKPIVQRDHGPLVRFKFSLAPGEVMECDDGKGGRRLLAVRSFSEFTTGQIQIGLVPISDARKKADIVKAASFLRPGPNGLREWNARKVVVSPLGEVSEAHD